MECSRVTFTSFLNDRYPAAQASTAPHIVVVLSYFSKNSSLNRRAGTAQSIKRPGYVQHHRDLTRVFRFPADARHFSFSSVQTLCSASAFDSMNTGDAFIVIQAAGSDSDVPTPFPHTPHCINCDSLRGLISAEQNQ
jgi:hypothetical protein